MKHTLPELKVYEVGSLEPEIVNRCGCRIRLSAKNADDFEAFRAFGDAETRCVPLCAEVLLLDSDGRAMVRKGKKGERPKDEINRCTLKKSMDSGAKRLLRYEEPQFEVLFYPGLCIDSQSKICSAEEDSKPQSLKSLIVRFKDEEKQRVWEYVFDLDPWKFVEPTLIEEEEY